MRRGGLHSTSGRRHLPGVTLLPCTTRLPVATLSMTRFRRPIGLLLSLLGALLLSGCEGAGRDARPVPGPVVTIASPAGPESSEPNFAVAPDGRIYLTWQEAVDGGHELRFATLEGDGWSQPRTIARGADWFVNWADFPTLVVLPDGRIAAHYLRRNATGERYHYDVEIVQSADGGESWSEAVRPHRDGVPAEHGFVSLFPDDGGRLGVVWLDGRQYDAGFGGSEEMMLRYTTVDSRGELGADTAIDARVCDCCQTAWGVTSRGPVVAYRGRTADEVRDIHLARRTPDGWVTAPVHHDGWQIAACPVNGPAVAASGERVVVAWFTAANEEPRVRVAFSDDAGATFGAPITVDRGDPAGRVDVVLLEDGRALVSWLERGEGDAAEILARVVDGAGGGESMTVATSSQARGSGFPRMARSGADLLFAWTDAGETRTVRVARSRLEEAR
jgi:hypothetical protein